MGRNVIYLPTCHSTNDYAMELVKANTIQNGVIVITDDQFKGRGQRGNIWLAEPKKNLTFSLILKSLPISASDQFWLNILVSVSIQETLKKFDVTNSSIKWPNDIMVGRKKLGGILIENILQKNNIETSIIGIGINVNQKKLSFETASSLVLELNKEITREHFLELFLENFEIKVNSFAQKGIEDFKRDYLAQLFRKDEWFRYQDEEGEFLGRIKGITSTGELLMERELGLMKYGMKEFQYLL